MYYKLFSDFKSHVFGKTNNKAHNKNESMTCPQIKQNLETRKKHKERMGIARDFRDKYHCYLKLFNWSLWVLTTF